LEWTQDSELRNGYAPFEADLYGTKHFLAGKRKTRFWEEERMDEMCEGLEDVVQRLLRWDGGEDGVQVFHETLPWEV
jgi:hypothetical protein